MNRCSKFIRAPTEANCFTSECTVLQIVPQVSTLSQIVSQVSTLSQIVSQVSTVFQIVSQVSTVSQIVSQVSKSFRLFHKWVAYPNVFPVIFIFLLASQIFLTGHIFFLPSLFSRAAFAYNLFMVRSICVCQDRFLYSVHIGNIFIDL